MCKRLNFQEASKLGLNRREVIKRGGQAALGMTFLPSLRNLFRVNSAMAANATPMAYLDFTFRAGTSFVSQVAGLDKSGNMMSSAGLTNHGVNPNNVSAAGGYSTAFGAPLWNAVDTAGNSLLLNKLTASNLPVKFFAFASQTPDDVGAYVYLQQTMAYNMNQSNPTPFKVVTNQPSGGSDLASIGGYTPVQFKDIPSYQGLLSSQVGPLAALSTTQMGALASLAMAVNSRLVNVMSQSGTQNSGALANAMTTGYQNASKAFANNVLPTPVGDINVDGSVAGGNANLFNLNPAGGSFFSATAVQVAAAQVQMLINGKVKATGYNVPGDWDIHTISGAQWLTQTAAFNNQILLPTMTALVAQKIPFWIDLTTDGSANWDAYAAAGGNPQGDAQRQSMQVSIAYHPNGVSPKATQAGAYLSNGSIDTTNSNPVTSNPSACAAIRAVSALTMFGLNPASDPVLAPYVQYSLI